MIKIFKALTVEALEEKVNNFEVEYEKLFDFHEHSISYADGNYLMSITITKKWFV